MRILLAPMEGVVDHHMRRLLCKLGGVDGCVTEFVRITNTLLPRRVFERYCPEFSQGCQTDNGVPVSIQLLGSNAEMMAENACKLAELGAHTIDVNFGCPAKTVNRHNGGACLLQSPEQVYQIIHTLRRALPAEVRLSAKIRLGYNDRDSYLDNARACADGGAAELVVHARSKVDGYKPPAYWDYIARIREALSINVVANGEIWSLADYQRCKQQAGAGDIMLGRGLLARPDLAREIHAFEADTPHTPLAWADIAQLAEHFHRSSEDFYPKKFLGNRLKQWLMYLRLNYPEAEQFFELIKRCRDSAQMRQYFDQELARVERPRLTD